MSNGTVNISVQLYWPYKLPGNYQGAVSVSFYTPEQTSYGRLVSDYTTGNQVKLASRFEENKIPEIKEPDIKLWYDPGNFIVCDKKPAKAVYYDIEGKRQNEQSINQHDNPFEKTENCINLQNRGISGEQVVFTAHVHLKTHSNPKYSRKWQTCGKICVLGKYILQNVPVFLPVFLRSSYVIDKVNRGTVIAWLRINADSMVTRYLGSVSTLTFEQRLFAMFLRNVRHEKYMMSKHDKFKTESGGLSISYASHYADGVLFDSNKFIADASAMNVKQDHIDWLVGTSPQSSFYYMKPVATAAYFLQNLRECMALHNMTPKQFVDAVEELYNYKDSGGKTLDELESDDESTKEFKHRMRRLINDVVRVFYLYFITRPYAPDISFYEEDGEIKVVDGDFTDAFNMGDCEDGAIGIHKMIMTMLFHNWQADRGYQNLTKTSFFIFSDNQDKIVFDALRLCTAMLGVPVGIVGESRSPETNKKGGGHMYGALIPLHRYVEALYDDTVDNINYASLFGGIKPETRRQKHIDKANDWFLRQFGRKYPGDFERIIALESTMIATPRYDSHRHFHPQVDLAYGLMLCWLKEKGMMSCGWFNITYKHLLGQKAHDVDGKEYIKEVHHLSARAFSSSYLKIFEDITDYNSAFYFQALDGSQRPNALTFDQLFLEPTNFRLVPSDPGGPKDEAEAGSKIVNKGEYDAELFLEHQIHRPDPLIDVGVADIFNDEQWKELAKCIMNGSEYEKDMYEKDVSLHGEDYAKEAYSISETVQKQAVDRFGGYENVRGLVDKFNGFKRSDITEESHLTFYVYSWYPKSLLDVFDLISSIKKVDSIRVLKYGWCTAVVVNISINE